MNLFFTKNWRNSNVWINWIRNNPVHFKEYKSVPRSEQIGVVLKTLGFERIDSETEVIYQ
jgi:hypothetical protein